jgi:DinB family protein
MRTIARSLLVVAAALLILIAHAKAAPMSDPAPKSADSPSKVLLDNWNDVGRKLIAMAEDFPENKYDFKPNPAERSFAEQLLHAAVNVNYFVNNLAKGVKPSSGDVNRADYATKAAVVEYLKKSFADGAALIKNKGDRGMGDLCIDPFTNQQDRFSDLAWGFIEHSGEHYGQLVVYYRVAGMVPPESRPKK